jgi:hypothetical protein
VNFISPAFELHPKQRLANKILGSPATHILLRGGSRSGKSFLLMRAIVLRALKVKSSHVIFRQRFNHLKSSIIAKTMPDVMRICFPGIKIHLNKTDFFYTLPNGSVIWLAGLDDNERTEKILGSEHSTLWFNECSQISYQSRNTGITRLAENSGLALKAYYDCNPPDKGHWTYSLWFHHVEPTDKKQLEDAGDYAEMQMNPQDNIDNLPKAYIKSLQALPARERKRFLAGEFLDQVTNALFTYEMLEHCRKRPQDVYDLGRVCVAVDPSGCSGPDDWRSDAIGIAVGATDPSGREAYVIADETGRMSPQQWGRRAIDLYWNHGADILVAERNYGGAMVESTIRAIDKRVNVKLITASTGKHIRAEPVAALFEQKAAFLLGTFPEMEEQLLLFSTSGYQGSKSPDRADACIWMLHELMLGPDKPYTLLQHLG